MSMRTLSLLSYMHSLGLGLDLGKSLDRRGENARALIHDSQSFRKKSDGIYLTTPHATFFFFTLFVVNIWLGNLTFVRSRVILLLWLC